MASWYHFCWFQIQKFFLGFLHLPTRRNILDIIPLTHREKPRVVNSNFKKKTDTVTDTHLKKNFPSTLGVKHSSLKIYLVFIVSFIGHPFTKPTWPAGGCKKILNYTWKYTVYGSGPH